MSRLTFILTTAVWLSVTGCAGNDDSTIRSSGGGIVMSALSAMLNTAGGKLTSSSLSSTGESLLQVDVSSDLCEDGGTASREDSGAGIGTTHTFTFSDCKNVTGSGNIAVVNGFVAFTQKTDGLEVVISSGTSIDIVTECFIGAVFVQTTSPMIVPTNGTCPIGGSAETTGDYVATATFNADATVSIDEKSDGTADVFLADCFDGSICF